MPISPGALRVEYENGMGVSALMEMSGKSYEEVREGLAAAGAVLITGGPHDTQRCGHDHRLALAHATGRCLHPVISKPYTAKQRKEMANA